MASKTKLQISSRVKLLREQGPFRNGAEGTILAFHKDFEGEAFVRFDNASGKGHNGFSNERPLSGITDKSGYYVNVADLGMLPTEVDKTDLPVGTVVRIISDDNNHGYPIGVFVSLGLRQRSSTHSNGKPYSLYETRNAEGRRALLRSYDFELTLPVTPPAPAPATDKVLEAVKAEMKKLPTNYLARTTEQDAVQRVLSRILAVAGLKYVKQPVVPVEPTFDFESL